MQAFAPVPALLGGLLIGAWGWPVIFLINVPIGLATLWIVRRSVAPDRPASGVRRPGFDMPGAIMLALTLAAYALAMTAERGAILSAPVLLGVTGVGAVVFVLRQRHAAHPLIPLSVLREPGARWWLR